MIMNIAKQTKKKAQNNLLKHSGIFMLNSPSNIILANMLWQLNQQFKQSSYSTPFNITDLKPCTTRVRLVMHDACVLCVKSMVNSLDPKTINLLEQNELYYWKLDHG